MLPNDIITLFNSFLNFSFHCNIDKLFYFEDLETVDQNISFE